MSPNGPVRAAPEPQQRPDLWPTTARRHDDGALSLGQRRLSEVLGQAPAPLLVLDEADLRSRAAMWAAALEEELWPPYGMGGGQVLLEVEALPSPRVLAAAAGEGMGLSVTSPSGLKAALAAFGGADGPVDDVQAARLAVCPTTKTAAKAAGMIETGLRHRVGLLVLGCREELEVAAACVRLLRAEGTYASDETAQVVLGLSLQAPQAGQDAPALGSDCEDGLPLAGGVALEAARAVAASSELDLKGLHAPAGPLAHDQQALGEAVRAALGLRHQIAEQTGALCQSLSLGGGAASTHAGAAPVVSSAAAVARALAQVLRETCAGLGDSVPHVSLTAGGAVVGPSLVLLCSVTAVEVADLGGEKVLRVSVDAPAPKHLDLEAQASASTALLASRTPGPQAGWVRAQVVASGGAVLVNDLLLPEGLAVGEVLAVPGTVRRGWGEGGGSPVPAAWVAQSQQGWLFEP